MIDFLDKLADDPRSLAILAIGVICWLITRERPSRHTVVALVVFFAGFALFVIWKYAPEFKKVEPFDIETMTADELRAHILVMQGAIDVLWRQMEMYIWGVHAAGLLYLSGYLLRENEVYAKGIVGVLWLAEAVSLSMDNTWCRFVLEIEGSWLIETLMLTGGTSEACEVHWGEAATWIPHAVWAFVALYGLFIYQRARARLS